MPHAFIENHPAPCLWVSGLALSETISQDVLRLSLFCSRIDMSTGKPGNFISHRTHITADDLRGTMAAVIEQTGIFPRSMIVRD